MNYVDMATRLLAAIAAFDSTAPQPSELVLELWAEQIKITGYTWDELEKAVLAIGRRGGEPAKKKLGEVFDEVRRQRQADRAAFRALEDPPVRKPTGDPSPAAYRLALQVVCTVCGAGVGSYCDASGEVRSIPHMARMVSGSKKHA